MNINDLYDLVKDIVKKANELKNKHTKETEAKVNYACIFCKNEEEFNNYIELLKNSGSIIIRDTDSGPLFKLDGINTVSGRLKLLKIRKYDDEHNDLGDADFTVSNYNVFKKKYINNSNFKLINGDGYEMIELTEANYDVRCYFSNIPIDIELGIK